jgi:DNA-binding transcriptional ArsR family regulator
MRWLSAAMRLPGKALHVAIAIWQRAGMTNSGTIKLNLSRLDGVTHSAGSRGLLALEEAGLVTIVRKKGQSPIVTLREPADMACRTEDMGSKSKLGS